MKQDMKVAVLTEPCKIAIKNAPIPQAGAGEVLVKIDAMGICGSDLHFFMHGRLGAAQIVGERILGHEICATVVSCEPGADGLREGDRVALNPTRACGHCSYCRAGKENLCTAGIPKFLGNAYTDGGAREYFVSPRDRVYKLPQSCPVERAVLLEPFSVALNAALLAKPEPGHTAVVIGAGCIGLMTLLALHCKGIHDVVMIDLVNSRLEKALELGAAKTIDASCCDAVAAVMEYTRGQGADVVIETVGSNITQAQTIPLLKKGGNIVMVGMSSATEVGMDINTLLRKAGTLHTVFRFANEFETAVKIVTEQQIQLEKVITHRFELQNMQQAFEVSTKQKDQVIKAIIAI